MLVAKKTKHKSRGNCHISKRVANWMNEKNMMSNARFFLRHSTIDSVQYRTRIYNNATCFIIRWRKTKEMSIKIKRFSIHIKMKEPTQKNKIHVVFI